MGGDDLGSEDEAWMTSLAAPTNDNSDSEKEDEQPSQEDAKSRKRKVEQVSKTGDGSATKSKKLQSTDRLIVEAGRNIEEKSAEEQAAFLTTAVKHYSLLESDSVDLGTLKFLPRYFSKSKDGSNMTEKIKDVLSMKRLKKWKQTGSPCVVVICISARRAVAILKELSSLKIRVAKLFPKSGSTTEQRAQLKSTPFGLAVGTPHRLAALAGCTDEGGVSLDFEQTQLVVFDTHLSNKQYSVVSLPDTAPHCMSLIREKLLPELQKRSDIRVAFF